MCLDEHGIFYAIFYRLKCRVESFYVTNLTFYIIFFCQPNELFSFLVGIGNWFFYEQVFACSNNLFSHIKMGKGRSDHIYHICIGN